jgi:NAD+ synthase (glutamine-hydrolysing)
MADFLRGSECDRAVVELDGEANSAVLAALAREALGPECLVAACPRERGGESSALARSICSHLGLHEVPLDTPPSDEPALARRTREARLSDLADREGWMVFCDADKTALALGACLPVTARRALAPLGDVFSTSLKATARRMIRCGRLPAAVASALEPEDKRSESRERILELSIESGWTPGQIVAAGYDAEEVAGTLRRANGAESIRRRMPIVLQVSARSFGPGRRMPIACRPPGL